VGSLDKPVPTSGGTRGRLRPGGAVFAPALALIAVAVALFTTVEVVLMVDSGFEPLWVILLFPG
jgi:hypothetical protein